jgi:hypothetical protein
LAGRYIARKIQCYRNTLAQANEAVVRANTEKEEAIARTAEAVTRENEAIAQAAETVAMVDRETNAALARAHEEVVGGANIARDAAVTRAHEEVVGANIARDAAVTRAAEAVTRENEAIAQAAETVAMADREKNEVLAQANEAREELAARDQEIVQISKTLAAALGTNPFGRAEWRQYFGEVGAAPPLPADMATILDGTCPFWPNKKVRDTHLLVLIPATVDGVPFTLNLLGELIQRPKNGGHRTEYSNYSEYTKSRIGEGSSPRSYWVLMTRDVFPGSRNKVYLFQREFVAYYASRGYALPSGLEAATAILTHHAREGARLFGDSPWTYTRCLDVDEGGSPAVVGGFESSGLTVNHYTYDVYDSFGVSCLRKF